jgi:alpha-L-fucosidase
MHDKIEEILTHHEPDLLWLDGDWMADAETFRSREVLAEYYNRAGEWDKPVAANDRLGEVREDHGDFATPEYERYDEIKEEKWESCRGIGTSFGYNRNEGPEDHLSVEELVQSFVDIVSKNGNLLINVGPKPDGTIPEVQKERLAGLGDWLNTNSEAVFGSTYWHRAEDDSGLAEDTERRYTWRDGTLYAVLFDWTSELTVALGGGDVESASLLTADGHESVETTDVGDSVVVSLPEEPPSDAPAWVVALDGVENDRAD